MAIVASRVTVLQSAVTQLVAAGANAARVVIQNAGPNTIFVGGAAVSATTGFAIPTNTANYIVNGRNTALFAIAVTADQVSPANTSVLIELND